MLGAAQWLVEMEDWLALSPCNQNQWIGITGTRIEKAASAWYRSEKAMIHANQRVAWTDWSAFCAELTAAFTPLTDEEQTRKRLKGLKQTGSVANYIQRFRELRLRIPSMSTADTFAAFMDGLKTDIRKQIGPHVLDLQAAQSMASRADLYSYDAGRSDKEKTKKDGKGGKVQMVTDSSSAELLVVEQHKLKDVRKKRKGEQRRLKKLNKAGQDNKGKPTRVCNWCGNEGHFVKDCPVVKQLKDMAAAQGTSSGNA